MAKNVSRDSLGYLGVDFQYRLAKAFIEDKKFFTSINTIVNQNMFTEPNLRTFVGVLKEYYEKYEVVPSYEIIEIELRQKAHDDIERETLLATSEKIKKTTIEGTESIHDKAEKFFKQQNIIKIANEILKIASDGDLNKYPQCVDLMQKALEIGSEDDMGVSVYDNVDEVLSDEYRTVIPTGIGKVDETLEGGLGKGELGIIIGPSSFGKALSIHELVLTPNGFVENGSLKLGDYVIGKNGNPTKIIGVFDQGVRPLYRVKFSDGASCLCDAEHLWSVSENGSPFKTLSLNKIMKIGVQNKDKTYKFKIPICDKINMSNHYHIDYYEYGKSICDIDVKEEIVLYSTIEDRIMFLKGVMNKYGTISDNNKPMFTIPNNKRKKLVTKVVNSLGGIVTNDFEICLEDTIKLFDDENKQSLLKHNHKHIKRYITSIEYEQDDYARCIKVDADDELYVINNYIVTHNTSLTTAMSCHAACCKMEANSNSGFKVLQIIFEDRPKQIQRKYFGRISGVEAKDLSKPDFKEQVKKAITEFEDRELLKNNVRIKRFPSGEKSASDIFAFIKKLINSGFKPDLVIIDYFECLKLEKARDSNDSEWTKEGYTMRKLESMAAEFEIALWVTTQGTKDSLGLEIVTMDKAGGSFKKIQIGHIIMSIARTMDDIAKCLATIAILKNRAGSAGKVFNKVEFNNGTCRISTDNVDEYDSMSEFNHNRTENQTKEINAIAKKILDNKKA